MNLPYGIQRLLTRKNYSCSEPAYTRFRQDLLRRSVREVANAHKDGWELVREGALAQLANEDSAMVDRALACLFVVGKATDAPIVEPLLSHPEDYVRKAARTCLFEIRKRSS